MAAVLSNRELTLGLKEEHWEIMAELLPVLQPLQVATAILSLETSLRASACLPMIRGLLNNHLKVKDDDSATVHNFKVEASNQLSSRFPLSDAKHPLMIASILDPTHKHLRAFPSEVREAAYDQIRKLVAGVAAPALEPAEKNGK